MARDSFYTPKSLAQKLVGLIKRANPNNVVDFCVGDGELLRAAAQRWPEIKCYGSDISEEAINLTKKLHLDWELDHLDFLNEELRGKSAILKTLPTFDLILLNPPFSCIGGTVNKVELANKEFRVSTAMKFLSIALTYLNPHGILYAILPSSTAYSQKDRALWEFLETRYNLSILHEQKNQYFKGCTPNVILVSLNDFSQVPKQKILPEISLNVPGISLFRGKLSMNLIKEDRNGHLLIHTTNIAQNTLVNLKLRVDKKSFVTNGPAILIPRVGKPMRSKVCMIRSQDTFVLSDCIIAIKTLTLRDAKLVYQFLLNNWKNIEDLYTGTGARYITIERLKKILTHDISAISLSNRKAI